MLVAVEEPALSERQRAKRDPDESRTTNAA
jgi:hypothetical protein